MASLPRFFADETRTGSKETIWAQIVFFVQVGSGEFTEFAERKIVFKGNIKTIFFTGDFSLSLELTDGPSASSGVCKVEVNGMTDPEAKYTVNGDTLNLDCHFSGVEQKIGIHKINNNRETEINLSGKVNICVHLAPAS